MDIFLEVFMKKYALFSGRAGKREFLAFVFNGFLLLLVFGVASLLGELIDVILFRGLSRSLFLMIALSMIIPLIALMVRRLHDSNRSGWMLFLLLVPIFGWYFIIKYLVAESDDGPNLYGFEDREHSY